MIDNSLLIYYELYLLSHHSYHINFICTEDLNDNKQNKFIVIEFIVNFCYEELIIPIYFDIYSSIVMFLPLMSLSYYLSTDLN